MRPGGAIRRRHRDLSLGLLWFLQNDEQVPPEHRRIAKGYHLPLDEFCRQRALSLPALRARGPPSRRGIHPHRARHDHRLATARRRHRGGRVSHRQLPLPQTPAEGHAGARGLSGHAGRAHAALRDTVSHHDSGGNREPHRPRGGNPPPTWPTHRSGWSPPGWRWARRPARRRTSPCDATFHRGMCRWVRCSGCWPPQGQVCDAPHGLRARDASGPGAHAGRPVGAGRPAPDRLRPRLPRVPSEHVVVSDVRAEARHRAATLDRDRGGVNQHNYLARFGGQFWLMWSDGPGIEDRVGQRVKFARSADGLRWSTPRFLTPEPPGSGPGSPLYGQRSDRGLRYISRGFLAPRRRAVGPGVARRGGRVLRSEPGAARVPAGIRPMTRGRHLGAVCRDAINNFPPEKLPQRSMADVPASPQLPRRRCRLPGRRRRGRSIGGPRFPCLAPTPSSRRRSRIGGRCPTGGWRRCFGTAAAVVFLYRSVSTDSGRTWSRPVRTNFPDATSKFSGPAAGRRFAMCWFSNPNPAKRDPLAISISDDGLVFHTMAYLVGGRWVDYPHVIEHDGHLFIAFAGGKQTVEVLRGAVGRSRRPAPSAAGIGFMKPDSAAPGSGAGLGSGFAEHVIEVSGATIAYHVRDGRVAAAGPDSRKLQRRRCAQGHRRSPGRGAARGRRRSPGTRWQLATAGRRDRSNRSPRTCCTSWTASRCATASSAATASAA